MTNPTRSFIVWSAVLAAGLAARSLALGPQGAVFVGLADAEIVTVVTKGIPLG